MENPQERVRNAHSLIKLIDDKIRNWNERSQFIVHGVKNLSRSDMDMIIMYAENLIMNGGYSYGNLMKPLGNAGKVLDKVFGEVR